MALRQALVISITVAVIAAVAAHGNLRMVRSTIETDEAAELLATQVAEETSAASTDVNQASAVKPIVRSPWQSQSVAVAVERCCDMGCKKKPKMCYALLAEDIFQIAKKLSCDDDGKVRQMLSDAENDCPASMLGGSAQNVCNSIPQPERVSKLATKAVKKTPTCKCPSCNP